MAVGCAVGYGRKQSPVVTETPAQTDIVEGCVAVRHIRMLSSVVQKRDAALGIKWTIANSCESAVSVTVSFDVYDKDGVLINGGGTTTIRSAPGEKEFQSLFWENWVRIATTRIGSVDVTQ
jgi:hypothetical protein